MTRDEMIRAISLQKFSDATDNVQDVKEGSLFICIRGANFDGHSAIRDAHLRGAKGVVVSKSANKSSIPEGIDVFESENTRQDLGFICAAVHDFPAESLQMIGITGTNGKTTTTQFIGQMMRRVSPKTEVLGTLSGNLTTPRAPDLQRMLKEFVDRSNKTVVMEVSSQALDQGRVNGFNFDVVGFTNLSQDHLDVHGTIERYFEAKAKLFTQEHSRSGVIWAFDQWGIQLAKISDINNQVLTESDVEILKVSATSSEFLWRGQLVSLPIGGRFNVYNAVLASEVCLRAGLSEQIIVDSLRQLQQVRGRFQRVNSSGGPSVFVDYAHTPDGLEKVLSATREIVGNGRLIVVFGCGGDRDVTKRPIMGQVAAILADVVVITSDNPRSEDPMSIIEQVLSGIQGVEARRATIEVSLDRAAAIELAIKLASPADVVVVAGKGHETGQIVGSDVIDFDDVEVAERALQRLGTV